MLSHQQPVIGWKGKSSGRWVGNGHGKGQHLRVDLPGDMAGSGDVPRHLASRIRPHREGRSAGPSGGCVREVSGRGGRGLPLFQHGQHLPVHRRPQVLADDRLPRDRCPQRRGRLWFPAWRLSSGFVVTVEWSCLNATFQALLRCPSHPGRGRGCWHDCKVAPGFSLQSSASWINPSIKRRKRHRSCQVAGNGKIRRTQRVILHKLAAGVTAGAASIEGNSKPSAGCSV